MPAPVLRDRFLFAVLHDSGLRIGEALGLRQEDIAAAEREITVVPRVNDNGARSKSRQQRTIPVSAGLIRLYGDYLHLEYGDLDSDYVFVNLFAGRRGQALSYPSGLRPGGAAAQAHRHRFRPALVPAFDGHPDAARRGAGRGGVEAAGAWLGDHDPVRLWPPDCGGRTARAGAAGWFTGSEVTL
jgi:integrase/recombinase XerD